MANETATQTEGRTTNTAGAVEKIIFIEVPVGEGTAELKLEMHPCGRCHSYPTAKVFVDRMTGMAKYECPLTDCKEGYRLQLIEQNGHWMIPSNKLREPVRDYD